MRLTSALSCLAGAALVLPLSACAKLPRSPVPAALTDLQAESLARTYLSDHGVDEVLLHSIRPDKTGYLVAYQTALEESSTPPKSWRLMDVNNDGAVRELEWNSTQR